MSSAIVWVLRPFVRVFTRTVCELREVYDSERAAITERRMELYLMKFPPASRAAPAYAEPRSA